MDITTSKISINGRVTSLGVVQDVTERALLEREREEALAAVAESERKYRLLFEHMTAAFALHELIVDEQGRPVDYRFLEVNPAFERLTGASAAAVVGKTVKEVMPQTEQYWIDVYGKVALTGEPIAYQNYAQELGKYYDAFAFCPEPGQFAVVFTDVTERRQAEVRLAEQDAAYRRMVELAQEGIQLLDADDRITFVNQRMADLAGHGRDDLLGHALL